MKTAVEFDLQVNALQEHSEFPGGDLLAPTLAKRIEIKRATHFRASPFEDRYFYWCLRLKDQRLISPMIPRPIVAGSGIIKLVVWPPLSAKEKVLGGAPTAYPYVYVADS